jgi:hypothetical protein
MTGFNDDEDDGDEDDNCSRCRRVLLPHTTLTFATLSVVTNTNRHPDRTRPCLAERTSVPEGLCRLCSGHYTLGTRGGSTCWEGGQMCVYR